jgi:hypothetical protein
MRHTSHEPYTHHNTQSRQISAYSKMHHYDQCQETHLEVQRGRLSASAQQQQQRHTCCACVTLT